jgi:hypothetical protein
LTISGTRHKRNHWEAIARFLFKAILGLLLLTVLAVAGFALYFTVLSLAGAYGVPIVFVEPKNSATFTNLAVASGTLFLGTTTALLVFATQAAAVQTRDEARAARRAARASLDIKFDKEQSVMWASDISYVRVMVVNDGPAMAEHVVVTLERIEPNNPMLQAQYQVPNGPLENGRNVLPSGLYWKGHDYSREHELVCNINPQTREYFDVLAHKWENNSPWVVFWIHEWREAFGLGSKWEGNQPSSPLVMNTEYTIHISASAANADRIERRFKFRGVPNQTHFDFWSA